MSDLEDDLLALAGGEDNTYESDEEITSSKRKTTVDDYEDDEDEDTVLSKRRRVESGDDEQQGVEEEEDEFQENELIDPYPLEGKYKDEADREALDNMDEMEREQILFDRMQEMDKYRERKYLQERMKQQKNAGRIEPTRSSGRTKTGIKPAKKDKLSELRKQRAQHSIRKSRRETDYVEGSEDEEPEEEDDDEEEEEEGFEDDYYDDYDGAVTWGGASKVKKKRSTESAKLEDINRIKVGRTILTQYCFHSGFEDTILDTYGRINLGMDKSTRQPIYRMVKIIDVKSRPERAYKLGRSSFDIYLIVSQNKRQTKDFPMSIFSDSPITQDEFDRYLKELNKTDEVIDFLDDVNLKFDELTKFYSKGLTDKDINAMIAKKQKIQEKKGNISMYDAVNRKTNLLDRLKIAKQQGNLEKVQEIIKKLKEIDEILESQTSHQPTSESLNTMTLVNERNRKLNSTNIRKAEIKFKTTAAQQQSDGDPFSRLKTATRMFYQDLINQENEKALKDVNMQKMIDEKTENEAKIAKSTYRDLGEMDKLIKTIDFDFDFELVV
ncbi:subunit of the RNA polymerase II-associated Paf1 complex, putative [Candida dubliniensis CD36]|uniref:Subunit of the RNA polymerase II-associated Paf1 complex, putative n=1 Tax=Candida dubliniensis (strain CD36 / ATCC MYA-646 / CBS 7987 / NCPF 3949 / NRRL Y-17841) TaxID=573826 RepID=B9WJH7_CANDC|nr:subunit of the RNA polymerase II-associated Paf1 complex, putative [Candida dubliniensis CD36]CAX40619.1 subunit of the RNA polymerase II-associated Paf1 complex, putative [Candida dubliniensis CD36]